MEKRKVNNKFRLSIMEEKFEEIKNKFMVSCMEKGLYAYVKTRIEPYKTWEELKDWIIADFYQLSQLDICMPDGFYKNGNREFTVVNGKLNGEFKSFYDNGNLRHLCYYMNNKIHGEDVCRYYDGKIREIVQYNDGKKDGTHIVYHDNGNLAASHWYVNGKMEGEQKRFDYFGRLETESTWENGVMKKITTYFY